MRIERLLAPWRSWCGLVAVLVVAADLVWHGVLLSRGWFGQDDFLVIADAARRGFGGVLEPDHTGGFAPGTSFLVAAAVRTDPLGWGTAVVPVLAFRTLAVLLLWPVLTRLLGERWLRLPLLVLFCATPLTLWATQWWWVAVGFWPATVCLLAATWAVVARVQGGDPRLGFAVVGGVAVGLCFSQLAVLYPIVILGMALVAAPGETVRSRLGALVGLRPVMAGLLGVLGGYAVLRVFAAPVPGGDGTDAGQIVTRHLRYVVSEVWGGPWEADVVGHAALVPAAWAVTLGGFLLLGVVGATLQGGGAAARASWSTFAVHVAAQLGAVVLLSGASAFAALGTVPRVAAEAAPVLVLCLAGALSGALAGVDLDALASRWRHADRPRAARRWVDRLRPEVVLAVAVSVALLVSAGFSTRLLAPSLEHGEAKAYVSTLREGLRDQPGVVLYDGDVPAEVIGPLFGLRAAVSEVMAAAPERPVFGAPSERLRVVTPAGRLARARLVGAVSAEAPADPSPCRFPVRADGTAVELPQTLPAGRRIARLGYYTSAESFLTLGLPGREVVLPVTPGLHVVALQVDEELSELVLTLADPGATVCVTDVEVGEPAVPVR